MVRLILNRAEANVLQGVDQSTRSRGGFQSLLCKLQDQLNGRTLEIVLSDRDLERIQRYAFAYGNGGWESILMRVFSRNLGSRLAA